MGEVDVWIPTTPGGTECFWLARLTEREAWEALMEDAKHMPYRNRSDFEKRGYRVDKWTTSKEALDGFLEIGEGE